MYRYFLSWRYLKSRRTNLIGIVGIFVAVGALILILSIMTGFLEESRKMLRGSLSDLVLTPHLGGLTAGRGVPTDPAPLLEALDALELGPDGARYRPIESAAAHLVWYGLIFREDGPSLELYSNPQFSQRNGVKLVGIDVADEFQATFLRDALTREPLLGSPVVDPDEPFALPPEAPRRGRPRSAILVGEQLFRIHALYRGQVVNLATVAATSGDEVEINSREFVVAGTFRSRENELDLERVYLPREDLARFVTGTRPEDELPPDALLYNEVLIKLADYERDKQTLPALLEETLVERGLVPRFTEVRTWEDFRRELLGAIENERALMAIMLSLVLLVAGFTIFAILSMMVTEKRRDIGILTALGATPPGVLSLFLLIGFWDALLGATLGTVAGTWMAIEIDAIERWLSSTFGYEIFNRNVYMFEYIPSVVEPLRVGAIVLGAFVCTLVFAAIPAWKASSLDPIEALRYE